MKWFWENCLLWMGRQMVWAEVRVVTLTQLRVQQHKRYWTSQCMRIYHLRKNKILDFLIPKGNISSTTIAFFPRGGPYFSTEFFLYMQQWNQLAHINPVLHKIQSNVMNLVHPSKTTRICSLKYVHLNLKQIQSHKLEHSLQIGAPRESYFRNLEILIYRYYNFQEKVDYTWKPANI